MNQSTVRKRKTVRDPSAEEKNDMLHGRRWDEVRGKVEVKRWQGRARQVDGGPRGGSVGRGGSDASPGRGCTTLTLRSVPSLF